MENRLPLDQEFLSSESKANQTMSSDNNQGPPLSPNTLLQGMRLNDESGLLGEPREFYPNVSTEEGFSFLHQTHTSTNNINTQNLSISNHQSNNHNPVLPDPSSYPANFSTIFDFSPSTPNTFSHLEEPPPTSAQHTVPKPSSSSIMMQNSQFSSPFLTQNSQSSSHFMMQNSQSSSPFMMQNSQSSSPFMMQNSQSSSPFMMQNSQSSSPNSISAVPSPFPFQGGTVVQSSAFSFNQNQPLQTQPSETNSPPRDYLDLENERATSDHISGRTSPRQRFSVERHLKVNRQHANVETIDLDTDVFDKPLKKLPKLEMPKKRSAKKSKSRTAAQDFQWGTVGMVDEEGNMVQDSLKKHAQSLETITKLEAVHRQGLGSFCWDEEGLNTFSSLKMSSQFLHPSQLGLLILELLKKHFVPTQGYNYEVGQPSHYWNDTSAKERFREALIPLFRKVHSIMANEKTLVRISSPAYVLGDLHGNYKDLLHFESNIWRLGVKLCPANLVFLGDYVDRGPHSVETVAYLWALKLLNPTKVFLLRGNHETRGVNGDIEGYTTGSFLYQCHKQFDPTEEVVLPSTPTTNPLWKETLNNTRNNMIQEMRSSGQLTSNLEEIIKNNFQNLQEKLISSWDHANLSNSQNLAKSQNNINQNNNQANNQNNINQNNINQNNINQNNINQNNINQNNNQKNNNQNSLKKNESEKTRGKEENLTPFQYQHTQEGEKLWETANDAFDMLPLAAIIDDKIFCLHGGVPRYTERDLVTRIEQTKRPLNDSQLLRDLANPHPLLFDLLWSDPTSPSHEEMIQRHFSGSQRNAPRFFANPLRGPHVALFTRSALSNFLEITGTSHILRAHECVENGVAVAGSGRLVTLFSSSAYGGQPNCAAAVLVADRRLRVIVIKVKRPTLETQMSFVGNESAQDNYVLENDEY